MDSGSIERYQPEIVKTSFKECALNLVTNKKEDCAFIILKQTSLSKPKKKFWKTQCRYWHNKICKPVWNWLLQYCDSCTRVSLGWFGTWWWRARWNWHFNWVVFGFLIWLKIKSKTYWIVTNFYSCYPCRMKFHKRHCWITAPVELVHRGQGGKFK